MSTVNANILRRLADLNLPTEAFKEVLSIIADLQSADEGRKEKQRNRTSRSRTNRRDGNATVTLQSRDNSSDLSRDNSVTVTVTPPPTYKSPPKSSEPKKVLRICATHLPDDWALDEQDRAFAQSKGWDEAKTASEGERFRDHALSAGRRQVDWHAAWRKWVTSPYQQPNRMNGQHAPRPGSREDREEKTANALAKLREFAARPNDAERGGKPGQQTLGFLPPAKAQ